MLFSFSPLSLLALFGACSASPIATRQWDGMTVSAPSKDPWYTTPGVSDLAALPPGSLIDMRAVKIPSGFLLNPAFPDNIGLAWQIKFRTTDSRSNPTWAVTTLYGPKNKTGAALVSYQHFMDSADVDRSPSYAVYSEARRDWPLRVILVNIAQIQPNWYINVPDYEGPGASFGAGKMAGQATLDSIRIVRRLGRYTGLTEDVPVGMWGYSGGALATEWAAELQPTYAPELKITAAVMGGLTPNMTSVFESLSRSDSTRADLIPEAVRGLATQYPEVKLDLVAATKKNTWDEAIKALAKSTQMNDTFANLRRYIGDLLLRPSVQNVLQTEGMMGHSGGPPQMPLYIHHRQIDEVAPVQDVRNLVARYCGYPCGMIGVSLLVNTTTEVSLDGAHYDEGVRGISLALDTWLPDAFAGKNLPRGCNQTAAP